MDRASEEAFAAVVFINKGGFVVLDHKCQGSPMQQTKDLRCILISVLKIIAASKGKRAGGICLRLSFPL